MLKQTEVHTVTEKLHIDESRLPGNNVMNPNDLDPKYLGKYCVFCNLAVSASFQETKKEIQLYKERIVKGYL